MSGILNNLQDFIKKKDWEGLAKEPFSIFEVFLSMDASSLQWNKEFIFDYILSADYHKDEMNKSKGSIGSKGKTVLGALIVLQANMLGFMKDDWKTFFQRINDMSYSISTNMKRQLKSPSINNIEFYRLCLDREEFTKIYYGMSKWELPNGFTFPHIEIIKNFTAEEKEKFIDNLVFYSHKQQIGWRNGRLEDFYTLFGDEKKTLEWMYKNYMIPDYSDKFSFAGSAQKLLQHSSPSVYEEFMFETINKPGFNGDDVWHLMKYYADNDDISISDETAQKLLDLKDRYEMLQSKVNKWILEPVAHVLDKEQLNKFAKKVGGSAIFKSKKLTLDEKMDLSKEHDIEPWDSNLIRDEFFYTEEEILKYPDWFPVSGMKYQGHLFISPDGYKKLKQLQKIGRGGPRYRKEWTNLKKISSRLMGRNQLTIKNFKYLALKTHASSEEIADIISNYSINYIPENMKTMNVFFNKFK